MIKSVWRDQSGSLHANAVQRASGRDVEGFQVRAAEGAVLGKRPPETVLHQLIGGRRKLGWSALAIDAIDRMPRFRVTGSSAREALLNRQIECKNRAHELGVDPPDIANWQYRSALTKRPT